MSSPNIVTCPNRGTFVTQRNSRAKSLILLVVREGLEPVGDASEISNLLKFIALLSPKIPLTPRIWHSIWHWHGKRE
jgi:hypothetical protein